MVAFNRSLVGAEGSEGSDLLHYNLDSSSCSNHNKASYSLSSRKDQRHMDSLELSDYFLDVSAETS